MHENELSQITEQGVSELGLARRPTAVYHQVLTGDVTAASPAQETAKRRVGCTMPPLSAWCAAGLPEQFFNGRFSRIGFHHAHTNRLSNVNPNGDISRWTCSRPFLIITMSAW